MASTTTNTFQQFIVMSAIAARNKRLAVELTDVAGIEDDAYAGWTLARGLHALSFYVVSRRGQEALLDYVESDGAIFGISWSGFSLVSADYPGSFSVREDADGNFKEIAVEGNHEPAPWKVRVRMADEATWWQSVRSEFAEIEPMESAEIGKFRISRLPNADGQSTSWHFVLL